jgi:hypothetical protein
MTRFRFLALTLILPFALGVCAFGYTQASQDKHKDKDSPQSQDKHASPGNHPQQRQPDQPGQQKTRPLNPGVKGGQAGQQRQIERSAEEEHGQQRTQERAWQERRANHWEYEHRNWQQRGGYNGYRVPDDYFHDHYGDGHAFRIYSLPFLYEGGNPRFQYGGYWFTMLDPYPEDWGGRWYETDDVYVAYRGDGYYLFNRNHSRSFGIALSVSL